MNLNPQISDFSIKQGQSNRIYFRSTKPLKLGLDSKDGFIVDDYTITGVEVNNTTGDHYFITGTSLNFWDNILIRYEGGSDLDLKKNM